MINSAKQDIYIEIFTLILPFLRSIETRPLWDRQKYRSLFADLELIHNLAPCLMYPNFTDQDIYWLNTQAKIFVNEAKVSPYYASVVELIRKLFQSVPDELRPKLIWGGP